MKKIYYIQWWFKTEVMTTKKHSFTPYNLSLSYTEYRLHGHFGLDIFGWGNLSKAQNKPHKKNCCQHALLGNAFSGKLVLATQMFWFMWPLKSINLQCLKSGQNCFWSSLWQMCFVYFLLHNKNLIMWICSPFTKDKKIYKKCK